MSSGATSFDDPRDRGRSRDPLVGTILDDRFQIDDVLGSGGMSVVYLATQIRVNRQVAIKTLKMQLDSKQVYRERFHREISLLCALSHPHIVTVYDCIFDEEQQPYVVMDYLRGRSLEALIKEEGALDVERFAKIAVQVCSALEYAHKNGVIHRDLKPGNLVLMDDEMDFVKVVDFGLAKLNQESRKLTQSGELWGSPPYLSPEQCIGKAEDARSDIYSFGCVMYEMLTGKDPFHNGTTIYELIQYHVNTPPPKMRDINPSLKMPAELEAVIFKAMEKDPKDRFQSAQELSNAIVKACAESNSRESGNLRILAGTSSGPTAASPNPVSMGMVANNFNLALDPMKGINVEDSFLDRGARKGIDGGSENKGQPTRQLARDRFSNMEVEPEPNKSGAGKMLIAGFIVIVLSAVALFAFLSMRTGRTETANVPEQTTSVPTGKTATTETPAVPEKPAKTATEPPVAKETKPTIKTPPEPVRTTTAPPQPVRVQAAPHLHTTPKTHAPAVVKHPPPGKPAVASPAKSTKPWDALKGMMSK